MSLFISSAWRESHLSNLPRRHRYIVVRFILGVLPKEHPLGALAGVVDVRDGVEAERVAVLVDDQPLCLAWAPPEHITMLTCMSDALAFVLVSLEVVQTVESRPRRVRDPRDLDGPRQYGTPVGSLNFRQ